MESASKLIILLVATGVRRLYQKMYDIISKEDVRDICQEINDVINSDNVYETHQIIVIDITSNEDIYEI